MLPGADRDTTDFIEHKITSTPPISQLLYKGLSPEEILERILGKESINIVDRSSVAFKCHCSAERLERAIISLGNEEIKQIIAEEEGIEAQCDFCKEKYYFDRDKLEVLKRRAQIEESKS